MLCSTALITKVDRRTMWMCVLPATPQPAFFSQAIVSSLTYKRFILFTPSLFSLNPVKQRFEFCLGKAKIRLVVIISKGPNTFGLFWFFHYISGQEKMVRPDVFSFFFLIIVSHFEMNKFKKKPRNRRCLRKQLPIFLFYFTNPLLLRPSIPVWDNFPYPPGATRHSMG